MPGRGLEGAQLRAGELRLGLVGLHKEDQLAGRGVVEPLGREDTGKKKSFLAREVGENGRLLCDWFPIRDTLKWDLLTFSIIYLVFK